MKISNNTAHNYKGISVAYGGGYVHLKNVGDKPSIVTLRDSSPIPIARVYLWPGDAWIKSHTSNAALLNDKKIQKVGSMSKNEKGGDLVAQKETRPAYLDDISKGLAEFQTPTQQTEAEFYAGLDACTTDEERRRYLFNGAGIIPFARKDVLANTGTPFTVLSLGFREKGGYMKDDDIAALIEVNGQKQILTFETNEGRNDFVVKMGYYIMKFGPMRGTALERIEMKSKIDPRTGQPMGFYLFCDAATWGLVSGKASVTAGGETFEAEYTQTK